MRMDVQESISRVRSELKCVYSTPTSFAETTIIQLPS